MIHLHHNMHHLIIVVGFGSVLDKIVHWRMCTLRLGFQGRLIVQRGRDSSLFASVAQLSELDLCSQFDIEAGCQNLIVCFQFVIANHMRQFPMRPTTTGRAARIMDYRFHQQKCLTLYIQWKLS